MRNSGAEDDAYGHYALCVSLVGMVSAFRDFGITEISARAVAQLHQLGDKAGIVTLFSRMRGFKIRINLALGSGCAVGLVLGDLYRAGRYFVWPLLIFFGARPHTARWGWLLVGAQLVSVVIGPQYRGMYWNVALAMAYAEPRWYLSAPCVAVTSFIAPSLILIPSYGALGYSAATLLSWICCAVAIGLRYRRNMRHSLGPGLMAVALGGAILVPCWLYRGSSVRNDVLLLAFLLACCAGLWITRIVESSDVRQA